MDGSLAVLQLLRPSTHVLERVVAPSFVHASATYHWRAEHPDAQLLQCGEMFSLHVYVRRVGDGRRHIESARSASFLLMLAPTSSPLE